MQKNANKNVFKTVIASSGPGIVPPLKTTQIRVGLKKEKVTTKRKMERFRVQKYVSNISLNLLSMNIAKAKSFYNMR